MTNKRRLTNSGDQHEGEQKAAIIKSTKERKVKTTNKKSADASPMVITKYRVLADGGIYTMVVKLSMPGYIKRLLDEFDKASDDVLGWNKAADEEFRQLKNKFKVGSRKRKQNPNLGEHENKTLKQGTGSCRQREEKSIKVPRSNESKGGTRDIKTNLEEKGNEKHQE
jgi:hypothetical protein